MHFVVRVAFVADSTIVVLVSWVRGVKIALDFLQLADIDLLLANLFIASLSLPNSGQVFSPPGSILIDKVLCFCIFLTRLKHRHAHRDVFPESWNFRFVDED